MNSTDPYADVARYEYRISAHNDFDAMVKLSNIFLYDSRVLRDSHRALQLLERAVKQGRNQRAMYHLAIYFRDFGCKSQRHRVIPLLEQALRVRERKRVLYHLACTLLSGKCGRRDPVRAAQLLRRALRLGDDVECTATLAHVMLQETSVYGDKRTGLILYKLAINASKNPVYMNNLATLYISGTPVLEQSYTRAVKWFKRAIRGGNIVARTNYATLLCQPDYGIEPDCRSAASMLEEVCHLKNESVLLQLAEIYEQCEEVRNFDRAFLLYERAIRELRSFKALFRWIDCLVYGRTGFPVNNAQAVQVCNKFVSFGKFPSIILSPILWSGTTEVGADPQRALQLCQCLDVDKSYLLAAMYRTGAPGFRSDPERAKSFCTEPSINPEKLIAAVLLSEEMDLKSVQRAERIFRDLAVDDDGHLIWLPLFLRRSKFCLPYRGDPSYMPDRTKRFEYVDQIAQMNLAILLLEQDDRGSEACLEAERILEYLMGTRLKELAMANLAYILLNGPASVQRDRKRAMEILESAHEDDITAQVMLVGALFEDRELGRSQELWNKVRERVTQTAELTKLSRLLPDSAREKLIACENDHEVKDEGAGADIS
ncbi:unnamed protein product [Agarophyton chilense]|eukprot:gb/GEZJ01000902.1/.p1 GENE.gb/GEZJ01000902.1/~~gb/GEZJ01000902.1/.p1  ORF type:complete len:600 (+),score=70.23 gb/GEZJ01000902.1/:5944-7743(+)